MERFVVKRLEITNAEEQREAFKIAKKMNCVVEIEDLTNEEISYPYWEELVQYGSRS